MKNSEHSCAGSDAIPEENKNLPCNVSILCRFVLKRKTFSGRILSCNREGMYFESDAAVPEGEMIFYQIADLTGWVYAACWKTPRTVSLAEVLSCTKIGSSGCQFGITVRYYRHYPQDSLFSQFRPASAASGFSQESLPLA
ncbi:MAG: hypothetical protein R2941_04230 [Desulfobacterales bacterium]